MNTVPTEGNRPILQENKALAESHFYIDFKQVTQQEYDAHIAKAWEDGEPDFDSCDGIDLSEYAGKNNPKSLSDEVSHDLSNSAPSCSVTESPLVGRTKLMSREDLEKLYPSDEWLHPDNGNIAEVIDQRIYEALSAEELAQEFAARCATERKTILVRVDKILESEKGNDVHRGCIAPGTKVNMPFTRMMDPTKWPSHLESFPRIQEVLTRKIASDLDEEILGEERSPVDRLLDIVEFLRTQPTNEEIFEFIIVDIRKEWNTTKGITMMQYDLMQSCMRKLQEQKMSTEDKLTPEEHEQVGAALELGIGDPTYSVEEKEDMWGEELDAVEELTADGEDLKFEGASLDVDIIQEQPENWEDSSFLVMDLSKCEQERIYVYNDGEIHFANPQKVYISEDSGTHRILSQDGWVTYIPAGWKCLRWLPSDPDQPVTY